MASGERSGRLGITNFISLNWLYWIKGSGKGCGVLKAKYDGGDALWRSKGKRCSNWWVDIYMERDVQICRKVGNEKDTSFMHE